jgi:hypothetical protein
MKFSVRILLTGIVIFLLSQPNLNAQNEAVQRGNFAIGSGIGYTNSVTDIQIDNAGTIHQGGNNVFQLHLTPSIGYFLANNFVVGLGMDYLVSSSRDNNRDIASGSQQTSDTKLLFGPYSRIYFPFAGDQAFFFGATYGYGRSETQITTDGQTQNVNTTLTTLGAGPGYSIFSNRRVSLEVQGKYNYGASRNIFKVDGNNQTVRTTTTAWDFVLGMHIYLNRQ